MTYVAADKYLAKGGRMGFVLPRTIFQSETGGWHFRRFELPKNRSVAVQLIQDIDLMKPFRGQAANTSCVAIFKRDAKTKYPVKWIQWEPANPRQTLGTTLSDIKQASTRHKLLAEPIDIAQSQSPWIVGTKGTLALLREALGRSPYAETVREGLNTRGANGIFFVQAVMLGSRIMITNLANEGRNEHVKEATLPLEPDYLYPLLRGEDVTPYKASPASYIVVPHGVGDPAAPVSFSKLPKFTREFLSEFRPILEARKKFRNFDPAKRDWHGLYSVLSATFSPFKVVWREMSGSGVIAAAVSSARLPDGTVKTILPDHKLTIIPCESQTEADFVAGFLNSDVANLIVRSYALATGISTHILERIAVPRFSPSKAHHRELADLAANARSGTVTPHDKVRISAIAGELLGLSSSQVRDVTRELADL
jgi:hypothetical protein